ncbi:MAG: hypothetical protein DHS20C05_06720 [Hyphococcus sp.]|nr:MAG: hypothetical protein DHS20C05_06720 [Marinicaulis sp.]
MATNSLEEMVRSFRPSGAIPSAINSRWPSSLCTARAAVKLINGNIDERSHREEVLFQVLASLVERGLLDVNDFWGPLTIELEAELRVRAKLSAADYQAKTETAEVSV